MLCLFSCVFEFLVGQKYSLEGALQLCLLIFYELTIELDELQVELIKKHLIWAWTHCNFSNSLSFKIANLIANLEEEGISRYFHEFK